MIIAVDAMGGDFSPQATVQGSIDALNRSNKKLKIVLLGDEKRLNIIQLMMIGSPLILDLKRY